jgi:hypothetical protein
MQKTIAVGVKVMYRLYNSLDKKFSDEIQYGKIVKIDLEDKKPYLVEHRYFGQIAIKKIEIMGVAG